MKIVLNKSRLDPQRFYQQNEIEMSHKMLQEFSCHNLGTANNKPNERASSNFIKSLARNSMKVQLNPSQVIEKDIVRFKHNNYK